MFKAQVWNTCVCKLRGMWTVCSSTCECLLSKYSFALRFTPLVLGKP